MWNKRYTAVQYQPKFQYNDRWTPVIFTGVILWPENQQHR